MNEPIHHLPGIESERIRTARLDMHLLHCGPQSGEPVLFVHGNLSSSTFWEETMLPLADRYRVVAADLRGYGLTDPRERIDATRGFGDWVDDLAALADALAWDTFHVVAHSMGGCIAWSLMGADAPRLRSVSLVAPGPPCGFGGARGPRGELNYPDGAGSGAGLANAEFVRRVREGDRGLSHELFSPRATMHRLLWKPSFRPAREEDLLTALLQIHQGDCRFPGDWVGSPNWPGFAPGEFGPINAMSPLYNQGALERLLAAQPKPPLLWVHGAHDLLIADESLSDGGTQGKLGLRPGWPGSEVFPPQPYVSQLTATCDEFERAGGRVTRLVMPDVGHSPHLERPAEFQQALQKHLKQ